MKRVLLFISVAIVVCRISNAQIDDVRMFAFGHSLIDHRPPINPTPSDETTVAHWMYLFAQASDKSYAAGGQYGFLPQHANLPPISQWGYDIVPPVWESDYESFEDANISTVMITAANFIQWQASNVDYVTDPGVSPVSATLDIMDWVIDQNSSTRIYIYENWPDMAGFLSSGFPPNQQEFENYNDYINSDFHNWWLEYQDFLIADRPLINVRMIPVGPAISRLLEENFASQIPITELYEDDAPHGRASIYFLAALVSHMAIYNEKGPSDYVPPSIVHSSLRENYSEILDIIWDFLQAFNNENGESRVFYESSSTDILTTEDKLSVFPNPAQDILQIKSPSPIRQVEVFNSLGNAIFNQTFDSNYLSININEWPSGSYLLKALVVDSGTYLCKQIIVVP